MSKKNTNIKKSNNQFTKGIYELFRYLDSKVTVMNTSKVFAGLMIVILNISSKFVTIKLSKTMEGYLKYTFSRDVLVFAICWVGSRDIYVAIALTALFIFMVDYLLNEDSSLCMLSKGFKDYHISLVEGNTTITEEEIKKAKEVLEKAEQQTQEGAAGSMKTSDNTDKKFASASTTSTGRTVGAKNTGGSFSSNRATSSGRSNQQQNMPNLT